MTLMQREHYQVDRHLYPVTLLPLAGNALLCVSHAVSTLHTGGVNANGAELEAPLHASPSCNVHPAYG